MTTRILPEGLPGCGRAASARFELYADARYSSLDGALHLCAEHADAYALRKATGLVPYRVPLGPGGPGRCGDGWDFLAGKPLKAPEPSTQPDVLAGEHPAWCARAECSVDAQGQGTHTSCRSIVAGDNLTVTLHLDHSVTLPGLPVLVVLELADPIDVAERGDEEGLSWVAPMPLGQAEALRFALGGLLDAAREGGAR